MSSTEIFTQLQTFKFKKTYRITIKLNPAIWQLPIPTCSETRKDETLLQNTRSFPSVVSHKCKSLKKSFKEDLYQIFRT